MQTRREDTGYEMTLLPPLASLVPSGHRLRKLNRVLDLSFVHEAVRDRYCQDNGRPSIDPEVVLRLFMLQAIEGIRSVRELMTEVQVNLAYRWFIGYRVDEALPDHSSLSRALDRFGDEVFDTLFQRSIAQCRASGLLDGRVLHLDATVIRADIDKERVGQPRCSDPDARHGRQRGEPGYKQQTVVDDSSRVIVGLAVMPANVHDTENSVRVVDQARDRMGQSPEAICADAAYANGDNAVAMEDRHIRLVSPPQRPRTTSKERYFTIEQFTYDEHRDVFTCPAGQILKFIGVPKDRPDRRKYRAPRPACRACPLKDQCTQASVRELKVGRHHASLVRLRADRETESFRQLYRRRSPVIEGVFGESKQWHGLRRAWRRGVSNMLIQSLLIAAVMNFKRLAASGPWGSVLIAAIFALRTIQNADDAIRAENWPIRANSGAALAATANH
jgi:transposase